MYAFVRMRVRPCACECVWRGFERRLPVLCGRWWVQLERVRHIAPYFVTKGSPPFNRRRLHRLLVHLKQ
jgi:hypothetical protein